MRFSYIFSDNELFYTKTHFSSFYDNLSGPIKHYIRNKWMKKKEKSGFSEGIYTGDNLRSLIKMIYYLS